VLPFELCLSLVRFDGLSVFSYYASLRNLGTKDFWSNFFISMLMFEINVTVAASFSTRL
jgi:hypothetical protein